MTDIANTVIEVGDSSMDQAVACLPYTVNNKPYFINHIRSDIFYSKLYPSSNDNEFLDVAETPDRDRGTSYFAFVLHRTCALLRTHLEQLAQATSLGTHGLVASDGIDQATEHEDKDGNLPLQTSPYQQPSRNLGNLDLAEL